MQRHYWILGVCLLLLCAYGLPVAAHVISIDPSTALMLRRSDPIANRLIIDLHLTNDQAAGIISNLAAESWLDPKAHEFHVLRGQGGIGIAQWTGDRRKNYEVFCRKAHLSTSSLEANIRFLEQELLTTQTQYLIAVRAVPNDPVAAARAFIGYEDRAWVFRKIHLWDHARYAKLIAAHLDIGGGL